MGCFLEQAFDNLRRNVLIFNERRMSTMDVGFIVVAIVVVLDAVTRLLDAYSRCSGAVHNVNLPEIKEKSDTHGTEYR